MYKKFDFSITYIGDYIYIIGGRDKNSKVVATCEKYNYVSDKWQKIAPLNFRRYASSACAIEGHNKILTIGGRSEDSNLMIKDIELYDI